MEYAEFDDITGPELVTLDTDIADKEDAIDHLIGLVADAGRVDDPEQAKADVLARETEATTGVGMGIAIPHAKTGAVTEPVVAFTRAKQGVDFDAMDGSAADLIFLLLFPADASKGYLKTLSALSRALVHEETRDALYAAGTPEETIAVLREAVE